MTKNELLEKFQSEDYGNYVKHYMVPHWVTESQISKWDRLVTDNFLTRHTVEGTISEQRAVDVCRQRSNQGQLNFTSTLLTVSFMNKIAMYIAKNVIKWHGENIKGFANYQLNVQGKMYTVECKAGKGFLPKFYSDQVVVGIDQSGLINHFHGDAQYATGRCHKR